MTAKDIQDKADAIVGPLISDLQTFQDNWVKTHKGYWQGIKTPTTIPQDGTDTVPDLNVKPVQDDEATAWKDIGVTIPSTLPCSIEVHTHDGPLGKGWSAIIRIMFEAQTFLKVQGFGKESLATTPWVEVNSDLFK